MSSLRVAFVIGTLGLGGAEKQLVYMIRALQESGVQIRTYCLTKSEYYESMLDEIDLQPVWVGAHRSPLWRLLNLAVELRDFCPHIIQSTHFYANLYAALVAPLYGAVAIGCLRGNAISEVEGNGFWGMKLLKLPQAIIANSNSAKRNAISLNLGKDRIFVLPNVIDIPAFDEAYIASSLLSLPFRRESPHVNAVAVGRLISEKRFDRFLRALSKARVTFPDLRGFIVGEGVEREMLERLALDLGLFPDGVCFVGSNYHIPAILNQSDLLVLSSDFEGFPNVLLEAMLARLPVICTPAGDAGIVVQDGLTGFVVPFDDVDGLAASIVKLAKSSQLRKKLGQAGRARVEEFYNVDLLSGLLFPIYEKVACLSRSHRLLNALSSNPGN